MQIEIIDSIEDIAALKEDWHRLFQKAGASPFLHHSWVFNNMDVMPDEEVLCMAVFAEKRQLIGVFPFAIRPMKIKHLSYRALVHAGSKVTDYSSFLVDPEFNRRLMTKRVIEKLTDDLSQRWDLIRLDNLSSCDTNACLFIDLALNQLYGSTIKSEVTPIIDFSAGYSEAKKISNIQRRFRKIADRCETHHYTGGDITPELMAQFSSLHQRSFPDAGFDRPRTQEFYRRLIDDDDFSPLVRLSTIDCDGEMIAAHFGFADDTAFYYYVPTYNEAFSTNGPGQYLLWQLITASEEAGHSHFDLLRGDEDYKYNWTNRICHNQTLFAVNRDAGLPRRLLLNLWLLKRSLPFFNRNKH